MTPAAWALEGAALLAAGALLTLRARTRRERAVAVTVRGEGARRILVRDRGAYRELVFANDDGDEMLQAQVTRDEPPVSAIAYTDGLHLGLFGCATGLDAARPRRALVIGGGPCTVARQMVALHSDIEIAVVENDADVLELARTAFGLRDEPRLRVRLGDGREVLLSFPTHHFDVIAVDAFGLGTVPRGLATDTFFRACFDRLRDGGCLVVNLAGTAVGARGVGLRRIYCGVVAAFGTASTAAFGVPLPGETHLAMEGARNTIALARRGARAPSPREISTAASRVRGVPALLPHLAAILARPVALDIAGLKPWADLPATEAANAPSASLPIR